MKKLIKTFCLLLFTVNVSCQVTQTVPLKTIEYPDYGTYLKDLDNVLPFWEGTWKGTVNNKEYTFQFVKFTQHQTTFSDGSYEYEDKLMGKFKVVDLSTNQILYNDLNATNFEDYKIYFLSNIDRQYFFKFYDTVNNCYNSVEFSLIKDTTNSNQVLYTEF
ncbi:DUF6705 family protein [Flavobacterium ponti]|uniref:DUF6705 family protein n=1 Tax=Flavobacterium ponti TaxID=665133 RepID=A0ABV9P2J8_9FLAO